MLQLKPFKANYTTAEFVKDLPHQEMFQIKSYWAQRDQHFTLYNNCLWWIVFEKVDEVPTK